MTMWLLSGLIAPLKPVAGKKNWFRMDGVPKTLGYADIGEWLADEIDHNRNGSEIVADAKLVGVHDNKNLLQDDPRFNHLANIAGDDPDFGNEPEFVVVKRSSGLHLCAMMINAPERVFFEYVLKCVYPHATDWEGASDEWKRLDPQIAKEYAEEEAQAIARANEWQAQMAARRVAGEKLKAPRAPTRKSSTKRITVKAAVKKTPSKPGKKKVLAKRSPALKRAA